MGAARNVRRRTGRGAVRHARSGRYAAQLAIASRKRSEALFLAATDPANPYGTLAAVAAARRYDSQMMFDDEQSASPSGD